MGSTAGIVVIPAVLKVSEFSVGRGGGREGGNDFISLGVITPQILLQALHGVFAPYHDMPVHVATIMLFKSTTRTSGP